MSDIDRLSEAALKFVGSITRYAEEAIVKTGGRDRAEIENTLRNARAIGELTVLMSSAKVKEYLSSVATTESAESSVSTPIDIEVINDAPPIFIPHYDSLTASQIVSVLPSLSPDERQVVALYEAANRARATILQHLRP